MKIQWCCNATRRCRDITAPPWGFSWWTSELRFRYSDLIFSNNKVQGITREEAEKGCDDEHVNTCDPDTHTHTHTYQYTGCASNDHTRHHSLSLHSVTLVFLKLFFWCFPVTEGLLSGCRCSCLASWWRCCVTVTVDSDEEAFCHSDEEEPEAAFLPYWNTYELQGWDVTQGPGPRPCKMTYLFLKT